MQKKKNNIIIISKLKQILIFGQQGDPERCARKQ